MKKKINSNDSDELKLKTIRNENRTKFYFAEKIENFVFDSFGIYKK